MEIEDTGERLLPWTETDNTHYEHFHRYYFAKQFVKNKSVLDLGCGEGYGTKILAESATSVVGLDYNEAVINHAKEKYTNSNLEFLYGNISKIPISDQKFDVIVSFEFLEHIQNQEQFIFDVKKLLKNDGIFIVSTPNKEIYNSYRNKPNPFHLKELDVDEFQNLINSNFSYVKFLGQQALTSSNIWFLDDKKSLFNEIIFAKENNSYNLVPKNEKLSKFIIAVASSEPKNLKFDQSFLIDKGNMQSYNKRLLVDIEKKDSEINKTKEFVKNLEQSILAKDSEINKAKKYINKLEKKKISVNDNEKYYTSRL